MTMTDAQIREALAGLVTIVEEERQVLVDSHGVAGEDLYSDEDIADILVDWDAQLAAGKHAIEELDRRAAELVRLRAAGGALA